MTPEEIKSRLKELGITQGDLGRMWDKRPVTISLLVNRKMKSEKLEGKLALLLGVSLERLSDRGK